MEEKLYQQSKNLIYKMAWIYSDQYGLEVDELISEFNLVFCEIFNKFDSNKKIKFSSFLRVCLRNKVYNILTALDRKKRKSIILMDKEIAILTHDPVDSIMIYDNFVNNENPVIRKIARIVSIYTLPRTNIKKWLYNILIKNFSMIEIKQAFDQLRTLY